MRWAILLVCASSVAHAQPPRIPLCAGLTIVSAVNEPQGDYESILRVEAIGDDSIYLMYSTDLQQGTGIRHVRIPRAVLKKDLVDAPLLVGWFNTSGATKIAGSTAFGPSRAVFHALKSTGIAQLALIDRSNSALPADRAAHPNIYDYQTSYELHRMGAVSTLFTVTVNGSKVDLPVVRARGEHMGDIVEFYFLDDESNPLSLQFQLTPFGSTAPNAAARTVNIAYRCAPQPVTPLERALAETGRVDVYDIYFDFNSDRIREESAPTLNEISDILRRHPEWELAIEGHTDGIGSDAANLDLSQRRAAAVKSALTHDHAVAASRLATAGYGEARPKDRNDTLEGRARNRRVELVRTPR